MHKIFSAILVNLPIDGLSMNGYYKYIINARLHTEDEERKRGCLMINSEEIARLAGVSRSTVSRVINGYSNVPPETKAKVEQVIKEYGYIPNYSARNLAGKSTNSIGLYFVEYGQLEENIIHSSPFYSEFLANTIDKLKKRDYQLVVSIIDKEQDFQKVEAAFVNKTISGCILMGDVVPASVLSVLSRIGCPAFLVNQKSEGDFPGIFTVDTENYGGAYEAVQLLVNQGHRRIAHITGSLEKSSMRERFEGYCDCLLANGVGIKDSYVQKTHIHRAESGYLAVKAMMEANLEDEPSAIFAANDLLAFGAMRGLREMGVGVPDRMSIVGYDNAEMSQYSSPPLTTVMVSAEKIAGLTIDSLLAVINKTEKVPRHLKVDEFEIIQRGSVAPPPG